MKLSMPSFFLGVGTVVGALALGFGSGVMLTGAAVKEPAQSRIERSAHAEQVSAAKSGAIKVVDAPKIEARAATGATEVPPPAAVAEQPPAVAPSPSPVAVAAANQASTVAPEPAVATPTNQVAAWMARDDSEKSARQRRAERRLERKRLYAEQRAKAQAAARMRQPPFEERERARPELAFEREDVSFDFFGRSNEPVRSRDTFGRE